MEGKKQRRGINASRKDIGYFYLPREQESKFSPALTEYPSGMAPAETARGFLERSAMPSDCAPLTPTPRHIPMNDPPFTRGRFDHLTGPATILLITLSMAAAFTCLYVCLRRWARKRSYRKWTSFAESTWAGTTHGDQGFGGMTLDASSKDTTKLLDLEEYKLSDMHHDMDMRIDPSAFDSRRVRVDNRARGNGELHTGLISQMDPLVRPASG